MRIDPRAGALRVLAVAAAVGLGAAAGAMAGVRAGVLTALAGLFSVVLWQVAVDLQARRSTAGKRRAAALARYAVPVAAGPGGGGGLAGGVARYLRPEARVVAFRPRRELDELLAWCVRGTGAGVVLVAGEGGAGKTRLALELAGSLAACGWQPLWVPAGAEAAAAAGAQDAGGAVALLVDYAETRADLPGLLAAAAGYDGGPALRVVLLARSAGEWWQQLASSGDEELGELLAAVMPVVLGPLACGGGQREVFAEAVAAFAEELGVACPDAVMAGVAPDAVVLVVHAAALLAVLDAATTTAAGPGSDPMGGLLRHEARYWQRSAAARSLGLDLSVLRRAVAVACLAGADSEAAAAGLLSCITDLADSAELRGRVARWLHDLYPAAGPDAAGLEGAADSGGRGAASWLGSLQPDLVAERLIVDECCAEPGLIPALFPGLGQDRAAQALTVLARAAAGGPRAEGLLRDALSADLENLAVPALRVAVETSALVAELLEHLLATRSVPAGTLELIAAAIPYPSVVLAPLAASVLQRLADTTDHGTSQRAARLGALGNWLGQLGRSEEALAVSEESAGIFRDLAADHPEAFRPELAVSLNNQALRLADLGRREKALAAIEEAIGIRRDLAADHPDSFRDALAATLNNLSLRLTSMGRREEALAAIEEAIGIRRDLAAARPGAFRPGLAMSLSNQAAHLADLGRWEEALAAIEDAARIYRDLAADHPDTFRPDLAEALSILSH
jgi:tetratricopeptide (TPR) repeat protein